MFLGLNLQRPLLGVKLLRKKIGHFQKLRLRLKVVNLQLVNLPHELENGVDRLVLDRGKVMSLFGCSKLGPESIFL